jgi:hypothetical protein
MIVPTVPLRGGATYTVRSNAPTPDFGSMSATALPATSAPPIDTQLPGALRVALGKVVTAFADESGTPSSPAVPFLQSLATDLRSNYALAGAPAKASASPTPTASKASGRGGEPTPSAPPNASATTRPRVGGVSFADVLASVLGKDRTATPEQYATLFTLVARQLGVPARLVTGFRVPSDTVTLRPGTYQVTTADAWTWVEIPVRGMGWVVVDASPSSYSGAQQQPSGAAQPSHTPSATPSQNALITKANGGHAVAPKSQVPRGHAASRGGLLVAVAIGVAVLALLLLIGMVWRKQRRLRRRRRLADPRRRLLGAWQESLDVLSESGLPDLTSLTSAEVVAVTGARFGEEPASEAELLGRAANAAAYRPSLPVAAEEADAAWRSHATLRRLVRRRLGVRARVAAGLRFHRGTVPARGSFGPASWSESARDATRTRRRGRIRGRHTR